MSDWQPDAFDAQLRSALHARPEPAAPSNLAHRAIEMARIEQRSAQEMLARIRRFQRFNRLLTAAAVVLIAAALYFVGAKAVQRGRDFLSDQTSSDDTTSASATSTASSSSTETINGVFVAILAIGACATILVLTRATEGEDETTLRFG